MISYTGFLGEVHYKYIELKTKKYPSAASDNRYSVSIFKKTMSNATPRLDVLLTSRRTGLVISAMLNAKSKASTQLMITLGEGLYVRRRHTVHTFLIVLRP